MSRGAIRRVVAAVGAVVMAAGLLAACTPKVAASPDRTPVVDGAPAGFEDYYGQDVSWEPCEGADDGDYFCASITAPEDWTDPDAGDRPLARETCGEGRGDGHVRARPLDAVEARTPQRGVGDAAGHGVTARA